MAMTRKLTTIRSERLLGSYSDYANTTHMTNSSIDSELAEEDVWSTVNEAFDKFNEWAPRQITVEKHDNSSRRHRVGGLSLAFEQMSVDAKTAPSRVVHKLHSREYCSPGSGQVRRDGSSMATSAPVNVPGWSRVYRVDSGESMDDTDELDSEMIPPHEYLARSRSKAATSVFEGVGRTLKGRDLNRVRDAVWSQTGFYG